MTRACPLRPAGGHTEGAAVLLQAPVAPVVFVSLMPVGFVETQLRAADVTKVVVGDYGTHAHRHTSTKYLMDTIVSILVVTVSSGFIFCEPCQVKPFCEVFMSVSFSLDLCNAGGEVLALQRVDRSGATATHSEPFLLQVIRRLSQ